ncbi:MAG: hypothetical protein AAGH76_15100 [Pseudomonadota bacterium]
MEPIAIGFVVVVFIVVGLIVWKKGGLRGALFGAKILETVGEAYAQPRGSLTNTLRVHKLHGGDIGVEIVTRSGLGIQMNVLTLSAHEAKRLAQLLEDAS